MAAECNVVARSFVVGLFRRQPLQQSARCLAKHGDTFDENARLRSPISGGRQLADESNRPRISSFQRHAESYADAGAGTCYVH